VLAGMLLLSNLVCYLDRTNISVAIIPMAAHYKWSNFMQAQILSAFFWGYLTTQIIGGLFSKMLGGKLVLYVGVCLWSCFTLLTPIAADLGTKYWMGILIIARIGLGVGEGVNFPALNHLTGIWAPKEERTRLSTFMSTGLELGTLTALFLGPLISLKLGWEWTFYIFGIMGIIWSGFFLFMTSATPRDHPCITEYERRHIESSLKSEEEESGRKNSIGTKITLSLFLEIFKNRGVWAVIIAHTCYNYGWYVLLSFLPKLFISLGVKFEHVGYYTMIPYILVAIGSNVSGQLSDLMINKLNISVQNVRKIMQCTAFVIPSITFFILRFTSHHLIFSTILICIGFFASSFCRSGHNVNMVDLSPRLAGLLFSITNTFATVPGIVGNLITGWLLDLHVESSVIRTSPWDNVFNVMCIVNMFGAVMYAWWARGTPQFK
jgi:MFS family permease